MTRGAGGDVRWCTPQVYLDAVEAYAPIDLDPCWDPNAIVNARRRISIHSGEDVETVANSLIEKWTPEGKQALTFVNPPYGRAHNKTWAGKIRFEGGLAILCGASLIALVPASTSSKWFLEYVDSATCIFFPTGRAKFIGEGTDNPSFDVCFVYYGTNAHQFRTAFHSKLIGWSR